MLLQANTFKVATEIDFNYHILWKDSCITKISTKDFKAHNVFVFLFLFYISCKELPQYYQLLKFGTVS